MDLSLEADWIDDRADIIDDDIVQDLELAGFGVDLDLADMAAVRVSVVGRRKRAGLEQPALEARRQPPDLKCRLRDVADRDTPVRSGYGEIAPLIADNKFDVGLGRFEEMRGEPLALGDDLVGGHPQGRTADDGRARPVCADAEGDPVGIAIDVLHLARVDPEAFVQYL